MYAVYMYLTQSGAYLFTFHFSLFRLLLYPQRFELPSADELLGEIPWVKFGVVFLLISRLSCANN